MGGENVTRNLAAILYADVAGYSRLTGADVAECGHGWNELDGISSGSG